MAPRATQAGRSQPNGGRKAAPAQNGNGRRRRRDEDEEEEEVEEEQEEREEAEEDEDEDMDGGHENAITRMANDLVRLALFTEYKHGPLRRDEINKKVLEKNTRAFKTVFDEAQQTLKKTFGMELVPLQSQSQRDKLQPGDDEDGEAAAGNKKKAANAGPRSWMLRNALSPAIVQAAAEFDRELQKQEEAEWEAMGEDADRPERAPGTLIAWQSADDVGLMGMLFVILSVILVNGRSLPEPQLRAYLKKLRVQGTTPLPTSPTGKPFTLDTYLTHLAKLSYLDRLRSPIAGAPPAPTQGRRRARGSDGGEEGDNVMYEWRWGARAEAEIGEKAVAGFVCDVYTRRREEAGAPARQEESEEESSEEEAPAVGRRGKANGRNGRANGNGGGGRRAKAVREEREKKELDRLMREVERAAGGSLTA